MKLTVNIEGKSINEIEKELDKFMKIVKEKKLESFKFQHNSNICYSFTNGDEIGDDRERFIEPYTYKKG